MGTFNSDIATAAGRGKDQRVVTQKYEAEKSHRIGPWRLASRAELPPPDQWPPPSGLALPSEWALPLFAFGPAAWMD